VALAATLVVLAAAEQLARAYFPGADDFYTYPPGIQRTFLPAVKVLPGVAERSRFEVNSLGLRGDEPPPDAAAPRGQGTYRVLAVGGSTTQCAFVDQPNSWPRRLQTLLAGAPAAGDADARGGEVWVANAGRSGFTSRRHVVQLRHLLEQGPQYDLVLMLVGVNDLANRLEFGDAEPPREELIHEGVATASCFTFVPTEFDDRNGWLKRLGLFRMVKVLKVRSSMPAEERGGKEYVRWRRHRRNASEIRSELPDLSRALDAYRHNLAACAALAAEHGTRLVLIDQPSIWRPDLPEEARRLLWLGGVGRYQHESGLPYYSIEALAEGMRRYNDTLHAFAAEAGVESIHLADQLPKDAQHFYDDVHFNDAGSLRVADVVAGYLLERPPFAD
jgi:lysophospholipase L1-like esterase